MILGAVLFLSTSLLFVAMTVIYPILLWKFPWRKAPAVKKDFNHQPTVTVLMAVHNGETFLREKLINLLSLNYPKEQVDILVVSDGSTDATDEIASSFSGQSVRLLRAPQRQGKAAALNLGLQHATGELLFFVDVRQSLHADALRTLAANFADPTVGAATGELIIRGSEDSGEQKDLDLYWRYELWARALHSEIYSLLNTTGCLYCARRDLVAPIPPDTLTDDAVIPLRILFRGFRIVFDKGALAYDYPPVAGSEVQRRLRTLGGLWQVHIRLPLLYTAANPMRLHFLAHKTSRIAMPWLLLIGLLSAFTLPPELRTAVLVPGAFLLTLALLDPWVAAGFPLKRLTSPARTFLVMNLAAMRAMRVFAVNPQSLWNPTRVKQQQ